MCSIYLFSQILCVCIIDINFYSFIDKMLIFSVFLIFFFFFFFLHSVINDAIRHEEVNQFFLAVIIYSRDCLRNIISANASLYRAWYYKLWRNGRAQNDNAKKRLCSKDYRSVVMQRPGLGEKCITVTNGDYVRRIIRSRRTYSLFRTLAIKFIKFYLRLIKFYCDLLNFIPSLWYN